MHLQCGHGCKAVLSTGLNAGRYRCSKTVVTGHSRMGKAALCCGIYDERAAVVAPAGSGCGGMASMRLSGCRLGENIGLSERIGVMLNKSVSHTG